MSSSKPTTSSGKEGTVGRDGDGLTEPGEEDEESSRMVAACRV